MSDVRASTEFASLLRHSAGIGRDPLLVQGAGGNTSIKDDGILWVKASGTWLAEAESRDIMVPVRIDALLDAIGTDAAERAEDFVAANLNTARLRPSIEATMHAALPHRVVIHVHCVDTIAWACQSDAERLIQPLLEGLDWRFIPYVRPGVPLTRAILAAGPADVLVLGKHGLVVAADTVEAAIRRLRSVTERLRRPVRGAPPPDSDRLDGEGDAEGWSAAGDASHGAGTDPASYAIAGSGSLYPDHVIFLGPGTMRVPRGKSLAGAIEARRDAGLPETVCALVEGAGVLLRHDATPGAAALARCLSDVLARLDPSDTLDPLTRDDEMALMHWDAEAYRRSLDTRRA